jgi:hypothetical protein
MKVLNIEFPETISDFKPTDPVFVLDRFIGDQLPRYTDDEWILISPGFRYRYDIERLKEGWPKTQRFRVRQITAAAYVTEASRVPPMNPFIEINRTIFLQKWNSLF